MKVGCETADGLLNVHDERETCDVCRPAMPDTLRAAIIAALDDDYEEGAIEEALLANPDWTRDQAVDAVERIARERAQ